MPLYEFLCKECKQVFEKLVPSAGAPTPACPQCGAEQVSKVFSAFAVQGAGSMRGGSSGPSGPSGGCCGGGCGCH